MFRNLQAVWSSPAMAVPKKDSFRLVSDYKAVNEQVEKSSGVMPYQEADMVDHLSARFLELMAGAARRTKRVAKNRAIPPAAWTEGRFNAWVDAQDLVAHAVTLYHPRPGCQALAQRLDGWKGVLGLYRYTI